MEQKIQELAEKYQIPEGLLKKAIAEEKKKIVLQNRKLAPKLVKMIEKYSADT
ncbi:MAG: hypothetical protein ACFBSE_22190 [Prochloraceae cyanobacterium]